MKEHVYLQEEDLLRRGVEALIRTLGPVEAARFLALPRGRRLDSVKKHRDWQAGLEEKDFFDRVFAPEAVSEDSPS